MTMTTIKVPTQLRDRINAEAHERGITAASVIEELLDEHLRRRRMDAFGRVFQDADQDYWDEFLQWDAAGDVRDE